MTTIHRRHWHIRKGLMASEPKLYLRQVAIAFLVIQQTKIKEPQTSVLVEGNKHRRDCALS